MKIKVKPEDQALFRQAMRKVKPLKQSSEKQVAAPPPLKAKTVFTEEGLFQAAPFSDHEYLDSVDSEAFIEFARPGFSKRQLRELRQAKEGFEAVLDLHGKTVEEARVALHQFLTTCKSAGKTRALVIHGKGRGTNKPVLKNKLNHWLRQSEQVLAFCTAGKKDGGGGAVYLRLKRKGRT